MARVDKKSFSERDYPIAVNRLSVIDIEFSIIYCDLEPVTIGTIVVVLKIVAADAGSDSKNFFEIHS